MTSTELIIAYSFSNLVAVCLLILAFKRPVTARLLFSLLFLWAAVTNATTAWKNPQVYLEYADYSPFTFLDNIITGPFSEHITVYVLLIALGQLCIAVFLSFKGWLTKIALTGAIIFLLAITPLGIGTAFPCPLIMAIACYVLLKKQAPFSLWDILSKKLLKGKIT